MASPAHAPARPTRTTGTGNGRSVALDATRLVAMASVFLVHCVERQFGSVRGFNPGPNWGTLADRVHEWGPVSGGILGVATLLLRWVGYLGDEAVGVFILVTGVALTLSAQKRRTDLTEPTERRRWWSGHFWAIGVAWLLVNLGMVLISWFTQRYIVSPGWWQFWASLVGVRFTPGTYYYGLPAWWYIGLLVQFYLAFPWLLKLVRQWGPRKVLTVAVPVLLVVRGIGLLTIHGMWLDIWSRGGFAITRLPELLLGMCLGYVASEHTGGVDAWVREHVRAPQLALAALLAAVGFCLSFTLAGMAVAPLMTTAGFSLLILRACVGLPRTRALDWGTTRAYEFYLVHHLPCMILCTPVAAAVVGVGSMARIVVALVASLVGAEILHRLAAPLLARRAALTSRKALGAMALLQAVCLAVVAVAERWSQRVSPRENIGWGERPSLQADERWGWKGKPNTSTHMRWLGYDYTLQSDADGLPTVPAGDSGAPVMTVGDAFTSADGVDNAQSWGSLLPKTSGGTLRVVKNASVTGWGPSQEARAVEDLVGTYKPKYVVVETFVNDLLDVQTTDVEFTKQMAPVQNIPNLATLPGLWAGANLRQQLLPPVSRMIPGHTKPIDSTGYAFLGLMTKQPDPSLTEAAGMAQADFARIKKAADSVGATVVVVMTPSSVQVCQPSDLPYLSDDYHASDYDLDRPQQLLTEAWKNVGVTDVLDLRTSLRGGACPYVPYNMHWSVAGHQRVAEAVSGYLAGLPKS